MLIQRERLQKKIMMQVKLLDPKQQGKKFSFHTFWFKNGGGWVWWKLLMVFFRFKQVAGVHGDD